MDGASNLETYNSKDGVASYDREGFREKEREEYTFKKYFKAGKILDIGCGTGRTTVLLKRMGLDVTGIDYAPMMIARAKEKYPQLDFRVMNALQLQFPDHSFDYALFSFNGLDYLHPESARYTALTEIRRILKPGGIFVFSSKLPMFFPKRLADIRHFLGSLVRGRIYPYMYTFPGHGKLLGYRGTRKRNLRLLHKAGFEPVEIIETGHSPEYVARAVTVPPVRV